MAKANFYNQNCYRGYPLLREVEDYYDPLTLAVLPDDVLVDAAFTVDPSAPVFTGAPVLDRITRTGAETADMVFSFRNQGVTAFELVVSVPYTLDAAFFTQVVAVPGVGCGFFVFYNPIWVWNLFVGQTVTNNRNTLIRLMPEVVNRPRHLHRLDVANSERTRNTPPVGCPEIDWGIDLPDLWTVTENVSGHLRIEAGYNIRVTGDYRESTITLTPQVDAGFGEPCEPLPLNENEELTPIRPLDGGDPCNAFISTINGLPGPSINLLGVNGVVVTADPATNRITVTLPDPNCGE